MPFYKISKELGRKEDDKNSINRKKHEIQEDKCHDFPAAAAVFLVYGFVLWCCIKVGAESEKEYMKLAEKRGKEQQCDK